MNQNFSGTKDSMKMIWGAALILLAVIVAVAANDYPLLLIVSYVLAMGVVMRKIRGTMGGMDGGTAASQVTMPPARRNRRDER